MLTTRQAAELLGVTSQTVRRYYDSGLLTGRQINKPRGAIKINEESVQALLQEVSPDTPKARSTEAEGLQDPAFKRSRASSDTSGL